MTLNTACGWVNTDPVNLLIAAGVGASAYEISQVTMCMNYICDYAPEMVSLIQGLIGAFQDAQDKMTELNSASNGKTLIKADVLEWEPDKSVGTGYSPEREITRIRGLLKQYMSGCTIICGHGYNGGGTTSLIRS
jgi:hypothetical protein